MAGAAVVEKKLTFVEAGRKGALRRWGEPKVVRLDDLTEDQRRLVRALIEAARSQKAAPRGNGTAQEVGRVSDRTTAYRS